MTFIFKKGPKGDAGATGADGPPGLTEVGGIAVNQDAIAALTSGDLVLFQFNGTEFIPIRFATHTNHKLTLTSNGDFIDLNLAP